MCGIVGFLDPRETFSEAGAKARLGVMMDAVRHRGPDAGGMQVERGARGAALGLGHRRLSVIDVSAAGAQPMRSHCKRYLIVFNGEIYNFEELRASLEARRGPIEWRGRSDTEVLLELIAAVGVDAALAQVDGMFAFAVYDRNSRRLTLARDRFGEKPLYYAQYGGALVFGSELSALRAWPGFNSETAPQALVDYLKYSYVPAPQTIYVGVWKLPAAQQVTFTAEVLGREELPRPRLYWDMIGVARAAQEMEFSGTRSQAVEAVEAVLLRSTRRRMVADVPLGVLLSGGIDSSLTAALMQRSASAPVQTFSIGMDEPGYDETGYARAVAAYLGTDHTDVVLTPTQVQATIPQLATCYSEPFADASQLPTLLVCRMARERVTVALSGDGADELFGGYNRYFRGPRVWSWLSRLPPSLRRATGAALRWLPPAELDRLVRLAGAIAPRELAAGRAGEKLHKLAELVSVYDRTAFHDRLLTTGTHASQTLLDTLNPSVLPERGDSRVAGLSLAAQAMLLDTSNYLPDDVLTKVDRASMAVSLELRTPYLNPEVFELAWSLPADMKMTAGKGKVVLRELLYRHVPQTLVDRPKAGFAVPVGRWLRAPLRDWAESLLSNSALADAGVFRTQTIRELWAEHLSGRRNHETFLWSILMYQGWRGRA